MKIAILALAISVLTSTSCGDNKKNNSAPSDNISAASPETSTQSASPIKEIVQHYIHVKNALAADNATEAATGANAMVKSIAAIDQSKFTPEQKSAFGSVARNLQEQAKQTAANASQIDQQREHFVVMSRDVHDLVKTFGTTQTLYLDHCPMADNHKGANWISETEEIMNPYMGKKMPKCGMVEEVIKQ